MLTRRKVMTLTGAALLSAPFVKRARAEDTVLNIYNWADYIGETTIEDFQSLTNIEVVYDTYSSSEEMQAKMLAGSTGYDVVDMAGISMPRFVAAGVFQKLDRAKLVGWDNLDPQVLRLFDIWDPGNLHGIPYMWGSVGMTYNVDLVKERLPDANLQSLDILFKPDLAAKLADCGISILDSPSDILLMALKYLGKDPDNAVQADYDAAAALFKPVRGYIRTFDNSNYLNAIPNGELCAVNNWSGDYSTAAARASEAGIDIKLAYYVPETGAPAWADCLSVPTDAPHVASAYAFLNYMLQPEVVAKCTDFTNYANGNLASKKFVNPDIVNNPAVYPDAETMKRLWAPKAMTDEQERILNRTWTEIKTG